MAGSSKRSYTRGGRWAGPKNRSTSVGKATNVWKNPKKPRRGKQPKRGVKW